MVLSGADVANALVELGMSHVVWLPDSTLGLWEGALEAHPQLSLLRVCREGEAWTAAAGLLLGGARPIVVIQNTGLFESGDALRNVVFDLGLPIYAIVGYRSYLLEGSTDSARRFTEPVVNAWGIDHVLLNGPTALDDLRQHYLRCQSVPQAGIALLAEGKG